MGRIAPSQVPGHFPRKVRTFFSGLAIPKEGHFKRKELILNLTSILTFKPASFG
jgi:hypothetical protein